MSTEKNKNAAENTAVQEPEKKEIFIERGAANEDPNMQVCVNGVMYLLPRGKTSTVPLAVYNEIMRSRRARELQDQRMEDLRGAAEQPK